MDFTSHFLYTCTSHARNSNTFALGLSYTLTMEKDVAYKIGDLAKSCMQSTDLLGGRGAFRNGCMGHRSMRGLDFKTKVLG